ncbi:MAG: rod shape-determining protein MreD [Bacteroidetes bacterium]|nr:rod shape-determining protein MreD [Bacteroidota bacterium]MBX7045293.1 rod shape-determining protein MreD [Ignavibacteria bacterium]
MIVSYLKYIAIVILLVAIQKTLIWLIALSNYNISPDLVILMVIYVGIARGHIEGLVIGFVSGLMIDVLSGSFLGLSALCYTITGFIAGYFCVKEREDSYKKYFLVGIVFLCALIANTIYFLIFYQGSPITVQNIFLIYILSTTTYTTLVGSLFILFIKDNKRTAYIG